MRLLPPLVAATLLAGMLAAVPTAAAAAAPSAAASATAPDPLPGNVIPDATQDHSAYWSGWIDDADSSVALRFVTATFKVPTVTCTSADSQVSFWVGLNGFGSSTVEQTGVAAVCGPGPDGPIPEYVSWYERYPDGVNVKAQVSPGDLIKVSVYFDSSTGNYDMALTDSDDSSADISVAKPCPSGHSCTNNSAEVIVEDPGGSPANGNILAKFSTVNFSNVAVTSRDGTHGTLEGNSLWSAHEMTMEYPGSTLMAQPSARQDGATAFSDTWHSAG